MQESHSIDLASITSVETLKAMKSDQYDTINQAQATAQAAQRNLELLQARINQLQEEASHAPAEAPKTSPTAAK